jgi:hypothetical protein
MNGLPPSGCIYHANLRRAASANFFAFLSIEAVITCIPCPRRHVNSWILQARDLEPLVNSVYTGQIILTRLPVTGGSKSRTAL